MGAGLHPRAAVARREPAARQEPAALQEPAGRRELAAGAAVASSHRADPARKDPGRADPSPLAFRPAGPASAAGRAGRRVVEPGARSAAGIGVPESVRRSPSLRSSGPRSPAPGSSDRRFRGHRWLGSRRPRFQATEGACAGGPADGHRAAAALPRGASAGGHNRHPRHRPVRSDPRRCPAGRRGDRPGVFAWARHRHRGPGRCRHVPPGTSWTLLSSRAAGQALPHECRSGEIP
jgi:hypothetical protein